MIRLLREPRRALGGVAIAWLLLAQLTGPVHGEPRRWVTVATKSQVAFDASFPLGNFSGQTEDLAGEFRTDASDVRAGVTGALRVNPASLRTGIEGRDRDMRKALDVEHYPEIRYEVEGVEASFPSMTDRADVLLTITGRMRIRGAERPMAFSGRARLRDGRLWVRGEATLRMSDFGIAPPKRLFLAVKDDVLLRFDFLLAQAE